MLKILQSNSFQPEQLDRSIDAETLAGAQTIVDTVRVEGEAGIRKYAAQFGERTPDQPLLIGPDEMKAAANRLGSDDLANESPSACEHLRKLNWTR
jgi:histidinol dehydrogenase